MRFPWFQISAIATVVAAVFAWLTYCRPPETSEARPLWRPEITTPEATAERPNAAGVPVEAPPALSRVYLADLEPDRGQGLITELPSPLVGQPGYEHSLVIACPSNQTGEQLNEVTYETRYRYESFEATLRPYREPSEDVLVQLQIFSDLEDRGPVNPGVYRPPAVSAAPPVQARVGEQVPVSVPVAGAYYLRLRVVCEKPGGFAVLPGASVATVSR